MQKANLYEAVFLINRGIDDAVRGLERLRRVKDSDLNHSYFDEKLALFEFHRALLNAYFCAKLQNTEHQDQAQFGQRHRQYEVGTLDEVQVYRDVRAIEERRRRDGSTPRVRFLDEEERPRSKNQDTTLSPHDFDHTGDSTRNDD